MKNLLIILSLVTLGGCASKPVAVNSPKVLEFPASLLVDCEEGVDISQDKVLSENLKIMIDNNVKWAECRLSKRILVESIKMRQEAAKAP